MYNNVRQAVFLLFGGKMPTLPLKLSIGAIVPKTNFKGAELKQITARCGYRLSITPLGTGRNVFHVHPTGSNEAEVSTQDINEVVDWLRGQDLLGE
jgi:hypothetical protein